MRPTQIHIYLEFSKFGRVKKNWGFMPPFPGAAADLCTLKLSLLNSVTRVLSHGEQKGLLPQPWRTTKLWLWGEPRYPSLQTGATTTEEPQAHRPGAPTSARRLSPQPKKVAPQPKDIVWDTGLPLGRKEEILGLHRTSCGIVRRCSEGAEREGSRWFVEEKTWETRGRRVEG